MAEDDEAIGRSSTGKYGRKAQPHDSSHSLFVRAYLPFRPGGGGVATLQQQTTTRSEMATADTSEHVGQGLGGLHRTGQRSDQSSGRKKAHQIFGAGALRRRALTDVADVVREFVTVGC